jgi:hypothetical protein
MADPLDVRFIAAVRQLRSLSDPRRMMLAAAAAATWDHERLEAEAAAAHAEAAALAGDVPPGMLQ